MARCRRKLFDVMRDEHDGGGIGAALEHHLDGGENLLAGEEVEAGGGFIEQEQPGFDDQGAGDEAADFFTAAECCVGVRGDVGEADEI